MFVGEWSCGLCTVMLFDTQGYAWATYVQVGAFWTAKFLGDTKADGEWTQGLIDEGVITSATNASYC